VGVSGGNAITVITDGRESIRIRLAEIDVPEKPQAFDQRSKQSLSDMVFGKTVRVEQRGSGRYGRGVRRIFVGGTDSNTE
jgi:endonuclease YncB( thermonuclease family)